VEQPGNPHRLDIAAPEPHPQRQGGRQVGNNMRMRVRMLAERVYSVCQLIVDLFASLAFGGIHLNPSMISTPL
ncbi:MAG TPA: hypothetical protein VFV34_10695, partial [Blastocatellia bacterium]|nr:hypothetical protein [Blastocatellia bacterium]